MQDSLFSATYKFAPVGLMLLDEKASVVNINPFLQSIFSLTSGVYKGRCFGNALNCASVFGTDRSCGETPACGNCRLRRGIVNALEQDRPVRYATLSHSFFIGGVPVVKTLRFSVSTVDNKQGRRVMVSFSDMTLERQYEQLLTRELELETSPSSISRQNLIGIVANLLKQAGPENTLSVGMAAMEGLDRIPPDDIAGSDALRRFAEIARQCTRRQDVIGRFGEAFMFIFPGAGIHMAAAITRRIHDTMDAVFTAYGIRSISFSAGFMELKAPQLSSTSSDDIIRTMDGYLQTARRRGGSLFVSRDLTALLKN